MRTKLPRLLVVVALGMTGCDSDLLTLGLADCERNHTVEVTFGNRSSQATYEVIFDGAIVATLVPGAESNVMTVADGRHSVMFRFARTPVAACMPSTVNWGRCTRHVVWCDANP